MRLLNPLFRAGQSLGDRRLAREESAADFSHTEAAESFQRQRDLCFRLNDRMTTHKHHPQSIVGDFMLRKNRSDRCGLTALYQARDLGFFRAENLFPPDHVEREISRRSHDPRRRIFRNPAVWPGS